MKSRSSILKHRRYMREYYHAHKEVCAERARLYLRRKQERLSQLKDRPCHDCGEKFPYWVMDFDHKRDKKFSIGRAVASRSWSEIIEEINKCDLVCANCHRMRTYDRRVYAKTF